MNRKLRFQLLVHKMFDLRTYDYNLKLDIWKDKRTRFIESTIDTYILFTELDQKQTAHDEQFTDTTDTQPHEEAVFF